MAQIARPNNTIDDGGWSVIGAPTHHEAVNDEIKDDNASYIKCVLGNGLIKLGLSEVEEPRVRANPDHVFRMWSLSVGGQKGETLDAWLYQGTTEICQLFSKRSCPRVSYAYWWRDFLQSEAELITDYSALDVRIAYNSLGEGEEIRITMMEFEVADAASEVYKAPIVTWG